MAPPSRRSEPFSSVDAAWLHMDSPTNMAMITGVMMFDEPLDVERLKVTIERRLLPFSRFRQRVKKSLLPLGLPSWEFDPHFDLDAHIHRVALPAPGNEAALQALAGDLMGTPLDFTKPLWQMHLAEGFGAGCALICRLHHCIADGLALVQVLLSLADTSADAPWPEPAPEKRRRRRPRGLLAGPAAAATEVVNQTLRAAEWAIQESQGFFTQPEQASNTARLAGHSALALGKLLLLPPDEKTIFRGQCGVTKRTVWSDPIPLAEVKAAGALIKGTVNDVLLSAAAGGLRRYLEAHGQPTDDVNVRMMIPVSVRPPEDFDKLGNRFGLVILALPVGVRDPQRRLMVLKHRMDVIKATPEASVAFGILNLMGLTPTQIEKIIMGIFAIKVTGVMTNVPGPRQPLYLAGRQLKNIMFWVPSPGNLALGLSILSYAGEVRIGVATDAGLIPDPEGIVAGFQAELDEMRSWLHTPAPAAPPTAPREPCQAVTKAGAPCKNLALPGATMCRRHSQERS